MIGQGRPGWGPEEPEKDRKRGKYVPTDGFVRDPIIIRGTGRDRRAPAKGRGGRFHWVEFDFLNSKLQSFLDRNPLPFPGKNVWKGKKPTVGRKGSVLNQNAVPHPGKGRMVSSLHLSRYSRRF